MSKIPTILKVFSWRHTLFLICFGILYIGVGYFFITVEHVIWMQCYFDLDLEHKIVIVFVNSLYCKNNCYY